MIFIIMTGYYIGVFFDSAFASFNNLFKIVFSCFAILISIYFFIKKSNNLGATYLIFKDL